MNYIAKSAMNLPIMSGTRIISGRRFAVIIIVTGIVIISALASAFAFGGYRINITPSFPLGLWQIEPLNHPVRSGDTVFICLPENSPAVQLGRARDYLPHGLCDGGLAPLIKRVAAIAGQTITIHDQGNRVNMLFFEHRMMISIYERKHDMDPACQSDILEHFSRMIEVNGKICTPLL